MAQKKHIWSIRYSDALAELVERQAGRTFTEKFENLITRCVWELPAKKAVLYLPSAAVVHAVPGEAAEGEVSNVNTARSRGACGRYFLQNLRKSIPILRRAIGAKKKAL